MKTLIKNAVVYDALHDKQRLDVLIDGSRIAGIGAGQDCAGAEVIDLEGYTLFPGFIDSHVHVAVAPDRYDDSALRAWAKNGVSAVKELGMLCPLSAESYIEWLETKKAPEYTRVIPAAKYIDVEGGYGCGPDPDAKVGIIIETPEQAADAVTYQFKNGSRGIKIGIMEDRPCLSPDMVRAICDRAHSHGMWVAAHLGKSETLRWLLECGIDEAAHTPDDPMSEELLRACISRGVIFHTTVGDPEAVRPLPEGAEIKDAPKIDPQEMARREAERRRGILDNLVRIHNAGGEICVGTDFIFSPDVDRDACIPAAEMRQMKQAGIPERDVIRYATLGGAKALHIENEEGTIEAGKLANLVAVKGELDERFDKLKKPDFVMHMGVRLK